MWTRGLLKQNAWNSLKPHYWTALGVSVLSGLITGAISFSMEVKAEENQITYPEIVHRIHEMLPEDTAGSLGLMGVFFLIAAVSAVTSLIFGILISNPIMTGKSRFYVYARSGDTDFGNLFHYFKSGRYLHTVKVLFFRDLKIFLWTLCLIVPGIIKSFELALVPYLLADNPKLEKERAFELSKRAMDGEKWNYFVLHLSFLGWYLLGALCCGVGIFFVLPYPEATTAEFYACMKAKLIVNGIASESELYDSENPPASPMQNVFQQDPSQDFRNPYDFQ